MIRVWRAYDLVEATHLRNVLNAAGMVAFLRNEHLMRVAGEVPFDQTWPEVWIADEAQAAEARALIHEIRRPRYAPGWACTKCNEWLEGQFSACWNCGTERAAA